MLSPDASKLLRHWTPANQAQLNTSDLDLGSTSPALLPGGYAVQGGKDGMLRLLQLHRLPGVNARTGGELQTLPAPGPTDVFTEPAVWKGTWVFVATSAGTEASALQGRAACTRCGRTAPAGRRRSSPAVCSTSPGTVRCTSTCRRAGARSRRCPTGAIHWQSPIVADGRVAIAEGNANDHATSGVLDIFRLPG